MPHPTPRPMKDRWSSTAGDRHMPDIAAEWQAHVDAGRIGRASVVRPHVARNRDAMIAVFARLARAGSAGAGLATHAAIDAGPPAMIAMPDDAVPEPR